MSTSKGARGTPVPSTNKPDRHDIAEKLLKVALNTINQTKKAISSISIEKFEDSMCL